MMYITGRLNKLIWLLVIFFSILNLISSVSTGKIDSSSLNNLYENLLQREYAGPISFPDHQVERKAQRSPSLRLRFGRSDPSTLFQTPSILNEKRWFGDVNQKPIRSPSLRLRFGRRSDPLMANTNGNSFLNDYNDDMNDISVPSRYNEKEKRKPSGRLRWGRSPSLNPDIYSNNNYNKNNNYKNYDNYLQNLEVLNENLKTNDERYPYMTEAFLHGGLYEPVIGESESLQALLKYLQEYDDNQSPKNEFEREVRKPAPLRLRWGRSTGGTQKNEQSNALQLKTIDSANQNTKQENKA